MRARIKKIAGQGDNLEVVYTKEDWRIFKDMRNKAYEISSFLHSSGYRCFVYGSIARGDVKKGSDIDFFIENVRSPSSFEYLLRFNLGSPFKRIIVQATPSKVPKAHLFYNMNIVMSIPIHRLSKLDIEFYKFAGKLYLYSDNIFDRVPGVNKQLILIIPSNKGHVEIPLIGNEKIAIKILGISEGIIRERIRVLSRRDKIGRTGVYMKYEIPPGESIEEAIKKLGIDDREYV